MFSVITYKKARGRGGEEESRLSLCDGWLMLLLQRGEKKTPTIYFINSNQIPGSQWEHTVTIQRVGM